MKLSASGYSRGRAGTISAVIVMALLVAAQLDPALICGGVIVTWLAVTWFLSANKDKDFFEAGREFLWAVTRRHSSSSEQPRTA